MKKNEVVVGQRYIMKVSGKLVLVLITNVCQYGGWYGTNTVTNRDVRIRSAQKLRYTEAQWNELQEKIKAARPKEVPTLEKLLALRDVYSKRNMGFQVGQAEALLDKHYPGWQEKLSAPVPHASQT